MSRWIIVSGIGVLALVMVLQFSGLDVEVAHWASGLSDTQRDVFRTLSEFGDSKYTLIPSGIIALVGYFLKAPRRIVYAALLLFASVAADAESLQLNPVAPENS